MDGWMEMQVVQLGTSPTSNGLLTGHGAHAARVSQVVVNFKEEMSVRDEDEQEQKQTQTDKGVFTPPICRHRSCEKEEKDCCVCQLCSELARTKAEHKNRWEHLLHDGGGKSCSELVDAVTRIV
jgi:hypothetical protein